MTKRRAIQIILMMAVLLLVSAAAGFAQEATPTIVPPPSFTDGRISNTAGLGGLAIYCVDKNNNTHVQSFDNGAITVWGVGDQKYINLSAAQLRGNVEIPQPPSVMELMTEEAQMTTETAQMTTPEMSATPEATSLAAAVGALATSETGATTNMTPSLTEPVLLARATTPNGEIGFFSFGGDRFALQGHDDKGAFFTYTWTGCSNGVLDHTTAAFLPELEATVEPAMATTMEATAEAGGSRVTPEATTSG